MNRVVHFEVHTCDRAKMQAFYSDVCCWKITDMGHQMAWNRRWHESAARQAVGRRAAAQCFCMHIRVDDLDAYIAKVMAASGSMVAEKLEIPGLGWLVYCKNTEGNLFGMMQTHAQG